MRRYKPASFVLVDSGRLALRHRNAPPARAWLQLAGGLFGYGIAVALMIRSGLGLGPWDAFHVGIHQHTGLRWAR